MIRLPPSSTHTNTLVPYATLFRSTRGPRRSPTRPRPTCWSRPWRTRSTGPSDGPGCETTDRPACAGRGVCHRSTRRTDAIPPAVDRRRSEEHTSELQLLIRILYAVFCLKQKTTAIISTFTYI